MNENGLHTSLSAPHKLYGQSLRSLPLQKQKETAPKINRWDLLFTSQTVFVLMEPRTTPGAAGISKSKMLFVSVDICVVHGEEKKSIEGDEDFVKRRTGVGEMFCRSPRDLLG
jgi:hypothetical protein